MNLLHYMAMITLRQSQSTSHLFTFFLFFFIPLTRRIQLPKSGSAIQARVLVLLDSNLHTVLHVGHRIMGFILAGSRCRAGSCLAGRHNASNYGNPNVGYQCIAATCIIYKSHRCLDGSVSDVCVWRAAGVCARQLCVAFRLVVSNSINLPLLLMLCCHHHYHYFHHHRRHLS